MYILQMHLHGLGRFHEMLPLEFEGAELTLEEVSSQVLLDLFDEVIVDDVTLCYEQIPRGEQEHCSMFLRFFCPARTLKTCLWGLERLELVVEEYISCALVELFGKVIIDNVAIRWESEQEDMLLLSA